MTYTRFFQLLAIFTALAGLCAAAAHYFLDLAYALPLTVGTIVLFIGFCIVLFYLGKRTAGAKNRMLFTNVFMGVTMVKMFMCAGLILAYAVLAKPPGKLFVVPFFATYIIYTALEVIFLMKLAQTTTPTTPPAAEGLN